METQIPSEPENTEPTGSEVPQQIKQIQTTTPKKSKKRLYLLTIAILLLAIGLALFIVLKPETKNQQQTTSYQGGKPMQEASHRLVYSVRTGYEEDPGKRQYPVYELWYQDTGSKPVRIGNFGHKLDYLNIGGSRLMPNGKKLLLEYEHRIDLVDVVGGEVTNIWKAEAEYDTYGSVLNSDGSRLLVSSAKSPAAGGLFAVKVDQIELSENKKTQVYSGNQQMPLSPDAWRSDNKVIVARIPFSEFVGRGVLDLNTGELSVQGNVERFYASKDGTSVALPDGYINNPCNQFSGSSTSGYSIVDSLTDKPKGMVSAGTKESITGLEFNRSGTQVLVMTSSIPKIADYDEAVCNDYYNKEPELFTVDVSGTNQAAVASREEAYKKWYPDEPYAEATKKGNVCTLRLIDASSLTSDCDNEDSYRVVGITKLN